MNGKTVCAGTNTGHVFFYQLDELRLYTEILVKHRRQKYGKKVTGIEAMPNLPTGEERVLVTTNDSRMWMLNMKDKSVIYKYKGVENPKMQIRATFSDDGRSIISGSEDGRVYLWCTDQVTYFPFPNMYDNQLKSAILSNTRDYTMQLLHDENHFEGQLQGMFGLLRRGERKLMNKLGGIHESFLAHEQIVTTTAFAPTKTKQLLAKARGDIIFDHTPVYAYKQDLGEEADCRTLINEAYIPKYVLEEALPEEKVLYNYPNSQIIISADLHGTIKVWRMDSGAKYIKIEYKYLLLLPYLLIQTLSIITPK
ncbi:hypothetical protein CU098_010934 [Rhizopus stolonifer]|uniref:Uncharacterized protein n=1 Tax=Rhizopus stolonifer TaxID=4846 RepID=A0A367K647_RHIST|nr:hypothetical protein CU098_010934 [Rhizopus stolonifer]